MLLLASTSDLLRVISSSTANLDVHASFVDLNGSAVTPGRTNTAISSAETTTVVGSPGASTFRTVKQLAIRNRHASSPNVVTVIHTDGTTVVELFKTTLAAGEQLHYHEAAGFWTTDVLGRNKTANFANVGTSLSAGGVQIVTLASDVTNNNAVANTMQDVTGLSFSVLANRLYYFDVNIAYTAAVTTTGSRWSVNGPASPTYLTYLSEYSLTNTSMTRNAGLQAYDAPAGSNASSAATANNAAFIYGIIQPSTDGTFVVRFASEVASSAIVAKAGSFIRYIQVT